MNRNPSVFGVFGRIWLQNFRRQPLRTIAVTLLSSGLIVALLFFSAFFVLGFLVIGLISFVYMKFFGVPTTWSYESHIDRVTRAKRDTSPGNVLEGEFKEVDKSETRPPD